MGNKSISAPINNDRERSGSTETNHRRERVESLSYFYGDLSREQAEDLMYRHRNQVGSFLVRPGSYRRYSITIVVASDLIGHASIFAPDEGCYYVEDSTIFHSISDLVEHYKDVAVPNLTSLELSTKLKHPIYKFRQQQPYLFQEESIPYQVYGGREIFKYDRVGEHIDEWQKSLRARWQGRQTHCYFKDGPDTIVKLPFPPPVPPRMHRGTVPIPAEDRTLPKLPFSSDVDSSGRYLQPSRFVEPQRPDPFSTRAEYALSKEPEYVPMRAMYKDQNHAHRVVTYSTRNSICANAS